MLLLMLNECLLHCFSFMCVTMMVFSVCVNHSCQFFTVNVMEFFVQCTVFARLLYKDMRHGTQ